MAYIEKDCTIEHDGIKFSAGGAIITEDFIVAYPGDNGILKDWHGKNIGTWKAVSSWRINSFMGNTMYQIRSIVNGIHYTGRGLGRGMIYKGKRLANQ